MGYFSSSKYGGLITLLEYMVDSVKLVRGEVRCFDCTYHELIDTDSFSYCTELAYYLAHRHERETTHRVSQYVCIED